MVDMRAQFVQDNPGIDLPLTCVNCGDAESVGCVGCTWPVPEPPRKGGWPSPMFW